PGGPGASGFARESYLVHERAAVELLRRVLVMRTAQQANQVGVVDMGTSKALDVIEFEPASFGASVALLVDKGAPASHRPPSRSKTIRLIGSGISFESVGPVTSSAVFRALRP